MFLSETKKKIQHIRKSKLGHEHSYYRYQTWCVFRCDSCGIKFERLRGKMDPKRLSNNYFHVCSNCDARRFAQRKGIERKQVWNLSASSDLPISKL